MVSANEDTIAALATAPGVGAVAIVRVSGPSAARIAYALTGREPKARFADLCTFRDAAGETIDRGLLIFFPSPASYTGDDVVELQVHGGHAVAHELLERLYALGARPAEPGEFTLRAFLNDKIDLLQAESIADLVASGSGKAARAALRSLEGEFSLAVAELQAALTKLRMRIEAWLDFPDEELPFQAAPECASEIDDLLAKLDTLSTRARSGRALRDGLAVAIVGPPNAGKSSLLNRLAGYDAAIVTPVPGTTRDPLREHIALDGMPLTIVDTAGLRETTDPVEGEGVRRARAEMARADAVLFVGEARETLAALAASAREMLGADRPLTIVANKIDLTGSTPRRAKEGDVEAIYLSALTGAGVDLLVARLKETGGAPTEAPGVFSARRRHVEALGRVRASLELARGELAGALELTAEHLRAAQTALGELTGEVSSDDLLGEIFSTFCIGK
jgi:tRNA modification GTPase